MSERRGVPVTTPEASTVLSVSLTGRTGMTAPAPARTRVDDARGDLRGASGGRSRVVHEDDRVRLTLTKSGESQGHRHS